MTQTLQTTALVGTWGLTSVEIRYSDGEVRYPYGKYPQGYLMYTDDGFMSAVITEQERLPFTGDDIFGGTIEEQAKAARTYLSYCGPYTVDGDEVVHHVDISLFPNWMGQEQLRYIESINDDQLVLRAMPLLLGGKRGTSYLIWHRQHKTS
jgi:hypothetical protein